MKITIVSGSHRQTSQSARISGIVGERLLQSSREIRSEDSIEIIELAKANIPFWDEGVWDKSPEWAKAWGPTSEKLKASDAFVFVTPEWAGMVPAALKNFFLLCSNQEIAYKPALIVAVSAGTGGAYPVAELRMSSYKNTRVIYLPDHLIIRHVESMFVGKPEQAKHEKEWLERVDYNAVVLRGLAESLKGIRAKLDLTKFPNGL